MPTREQRAKSLGVGQDELTDMRGRHGNHRRGNGHYRWNAGRMLSRDGYVKIRVGRDHPLADSNGYCHEHVLVLAAAGVSIASGFVVHHRNGDRTDNRIRNLEVLRNCDHIARHNKERSRDRFGRYVGRNQPTPDDLMVREWPSERGARCD